jgi:hypothetical protein
MDLVKDPKNKLHKGLKFAGQALHEGIVRRRFTMPSELRDAPKLSHALNCIKQRWPSDTDMPEDRESPVFIFAAGWRSGSTLVQRLVVSSKEVIVWGEPLGDMGLTARLGSAISAIDHLYPHSGYFDDDPDPSSLSAKWIATLTPPIHNLRLGHRRLFQEWLGTPAKKRFGVSRWGFKEVRLTIHHARYLKWLFPNARFIFVFRNLFDAYGSWKGNRWGSVWPGYYSRSAIGFARHWRYLLQGFLDGYREVGGLLVKFEDLISRELDVWEITRHLGVTSVDPTVLDRKIRSSDQSKERREKVLIHERFILSQIGKPLLSKMGYSA